jgi:hypothetical protein
MFTPGEFAAHLKAMQIRILVAQQMAVVRACKIIQFTAQGYMGHPQPQWPALKPSTIAHKMTGNSPLLETGRMKDSIEITAPRVEELIKAAGAELHYLPPYSPDMNPIEKAFSKLKAHLRKIAERSVAGLMRALETCADIFKPAECANYFAACGYDTA